MKKLLSIVIILLVASQVMAQNHEHKSTASLNMGFSLVGALFNAVDDYSGTTEVNSYALPALQFTYDRGIQKWFSIGGAVSYQAMGLNYKNYEYIGEDGNMVTEDFNTKISRLNVAIRPLFHYGNLNRFDMYSGLRVGITKWSASYDTSNPEYNPEEDVAFNQSANFSAQVILYGLRGYFTDNLGANLELAIGTPHFFSMGVNYRW